MKQRCSASQTEAELAAPAASGADQFPRFAPHAAQSLAAGVRRGRWHCVHMGPRSDKRCFSTCAALTKGGVNPEARHS